MSDPRGQGEGRTPRRLSAPLPSRAHHPAQRSRDSAGRQRVPVRSRLTPRLRPTHPRSPPLPSLLSPRPRPSASPLPSPPLRSLCPSSAPPSLLLPRLDPEELAAKGPGRLLPPAAVRVAVQPSPERPQPPARPLARLRPASRPARPPAPRPRSPRRALPAEPGPRGAAAARAPALPEAAR